VDEYNQKKYTYINEINKSRLFKIEHIYSLIESISVLNVDNIHASIII